MDKETGMILGYERGLKFYRGRPEKAEKTAWFMDEYKIDKVDHPAAATGRNHNSANPWFLCRIHMNKRTKKSSANGTRGQTLQIFQDPPQLMDIYVQNNYLSNDHRAYPHHCPEQPMHDHEHHQQISDYFDGPIDLIPLSGGNSPVHELMTVALASDQSLEYGHLITTSSTQDQSCVYDQNDDVVQMLLNCLHDDTTTLKDSTVNVNDQYLSQCHAEGPDQPLHDYRHCRISDYYDGPIVQTCTAGGLSSDHESKTAASASSNQSLGNGQLTTFASTYDEPCRDDDVQLLLNCWDCDVQYCESMQFIQDSPMITTAGPCSEKSEFKLAMNSDPLSA